MRSRAGILPWRGMNGALLMGASAITEKMPLPGAGESDSTKGHDRLSKPVNPNLRTLLNFWFALVALLALAQGAASLLVPRTFALTLITDVVAFLLMLSAVLVFAENGAASTERTRLFWMLLAGCWGIRIIGQAMWMYFEVVLRKEAPK